jgi:DNA-directed RNA polymerase specialized sigma24 family protein
MPRRDFEEVVVPHSNAAFNDARWLTKNDVDAEDVVQDATIRALRFLPPCATTTRVPGFWRSCGTPAMDVWRDRAVHNAPSENIE